ncbi:MAG: type II toxin-antitoxin system death-on-curing family toxin [Deltaproteobacteria bacterium]|jgi:death-on-curing protein|nr:type II toxin-antitoxin system death-on-curing family toxin [Deltaproteobacteria bacterium]
MRDYLTTADILGLHHVLLEKYGGAGGLRDLGALEAAVFRPQCGYYADIVEEAAALLESLLINHPFIDGNKRVAFAACDVFLRINRFRLTAAPAWIYERMMAWITAADDRLELIKCDLKTCLISIS